MSTEQNKQQVLEFIEMINSPDWETLYRAAYPEQEEFIQEHKIFRQAFADYHFYLNTIVAEGDVVAWFGKVKATHVAEFPMGELKGIPATGKALEWDEANFIQFENGKLKSVNLFIDGVSRHKQLGVLQIPA